MSNLLPPGSGPGFSRHAVDELSAEGQPCPLITPDRTEPLIDRLVEGNAPAAGALPDEDHGPRLPAAIWKEATSIRR
jgi:hypothetical protein